VNESFPSFDDVFAGLLPAYGLPVNACWRKSGDGERYQEWLDPYHPHSGIPKACGKIKRILYLDGR
jgi:hypothetical protein